MRLTMGRRSSLGSSVDRAVRAGGCRLWRQNWLESATALDLQCVVRDLETKLSRRCPDNDATAFSLKALETQPLIFREAGYRFQSTFGAAAQCIVRCAGRSRGGDQLGAVAEDFDEPFPVHTCRYEYQRSDSKWKMSCQLAPRDLAKCLDVARSRLPEQDVSLKGCAGRVVDIADDLHGAARECSG